MAQGFEEQFGVERAAAWRLFHQESTTHPATIEAWQQFTSGDIGNKEAWEAFNAKVNAVPELVSLREAWEALVLPNRQILKS